MRPPEPDMELAIQTADKMDRLSNELIETSEFIEIQHYKIAVGEYLLTGAAAIATVVGLLDSGLSPLVKSAIFFIDGAAASAFIGARFYFAFYGERQSELMKWSADSLKTATMNLRITVTQPHDEATRAVLKEQIRAGIDEINRVQSRFSLVVSLLEAESPEARRPILRKLLRPRIGKSRP